MSISVSWDQVLTWRLRRQFVATPTDAGAAVIAARLCGVQAQVASSADLALRLRQVDPSAGGAASALAEGRLIKTCAYGPASSKTFDSWLSGGSSGTPKVRGWFSALGERITAVDVEGRPGYLCAEHVDELLATTPSRSVHLLGGFDDYVLGPGTGDPSLLAAEHRALVSRAAGWISPIVVVDGRIGGVWESVGGAVDLRLFPGTRRLTKKELGPALDRLRRAQLGRSNQLNNLLPRSVRTGRDLSASERAY